jgi:hypothetical protein
MEVCYGLKGFILPGVAQPDYPVDISGNSRAKKFY